MKKELFNAIGEIEVKTNENTVKSEIDRTYAMVMKKIYYDKRKHRKKKIIVSIMTVSISVAAVIGIFVLSKNSIINTHLDNSDQIIAEKKEREHGLHKVDIIVYVYEAQNKSQPVTSLYASEMVKREVKTDTKIYLGSYNSLTSSVPGYPMMISNNSFNESEQNEKNLIRISVDKGNLIRWDKDTGKTTEVGKEGFFEPNDNVFWSPLDDGILCKSARIIVDLLEDKNKIATSSIIIEEQESGVYTAEKVN